ncbi:MAG: dihydroorotate dehydrogenase electron transfer subunit [Promethearchaeota archaeon]|nr:MAG: dihydroorotate dehydrogenase electron transfer subunit [Candidatus Lokiarchaeota archaeon]
MTKNEQSITDKPFTTEIKSVVQETPLMKTYYVSFVVQGKIPSVIPGQFILVWIPGIDEIPMAISHVLDNGDIGFTVKDVGEATHALHKMKIGDLIGIRGPYGNGYQLKDGFSIIIGGGIGIASIRLLVQKALQKNPNHLLVIVGAQTAKELLYLEELQEILKPSQMLVCTDDGSHGNEGFVTMILEKNLLHIKEKAGANRITVYACGPEIMLTNLLKVCNTHKLELEASLERFMRCGFGLCGLCVVDPLGIKICQNGPVLNSAVLNELDDFGKFHRDVTGEKYRIDSNHG